MAGGISWRPGAAELLREVRGAGLATALVDDDAAPAGRHRARDVIRRRPWRGPVRRHDLRRRGAGPQADPAPYRQAMQALGVDPGECVVVEDSQAGITAGLAAGAAVLGVPPAQSIDPAPG